MKKMFIGLIAILIAASTAFAVQASKPTTALDPMYHWFDPQGNYLGYFSLSSQQAICNATTTIECRNGYDEIDFDQEGREVPVGTVQAPLKKLN